MKGQTLPEYQRSADSLEPTASRPVPFVALSRFTVANGMGDQVKEAFRNRPHLVDQAPGFLRMEVISPRDDPREIWLFTYWRNEEAFRRWYRTHLYQQAHEGIPDGLKLVPGSVQLRYFELIGT
jgi:heme oxygenase (mycobilin-producing)